MDLSTEQGIVIVVHLQSKDAGQPADTVSGSDDLALGGHPGRTGRAAEGRRNTVRPLPVRGVGDLDVHVRLGAVVRVAAFSQGLLDPHVPARTNLHRASAQMGQHDERPVRVTAMTT